MIRHAISVTSVYARASCMKLTKKADEAISAVANTPTRGENQSAPMRYVIAIASGPSNSENRHGSGSTETDPDSFQKLGEPGTE